MHHFGSLWLRNADTITLTEIIRPYGVGIDTHSKFIAVCVLIKQDGDVVRFEKNFPTAWASMLAARDWVLSKLPSCPAPSAGILH